MRNIICLVCGMLFIIVSGPMSFAEPTRLDSSKIYHLIEMEPLTSKAAMVEAVPAIPAQSVDATSVAFKTQEADTMQVRFIVATKETERHAYQRQPRWQKKSHQGDGYHKNIYPEGYRIPRIKHKQPKAKSLKFRA